MTQLKFAFAFLFLFSASAVFSQKKNIAIHSYYPEANEWETKTPAQAGLDAEMLNEAIRFAKEHESKSPRNLEIAHYQSFGREPFGDAIGPFSERGGATGMIIRNGYIIAEWGDPFRVDMTFSVTKSFLSTLAGIAYDKGLIKSVNDTVYKLMAPVSVYRPGISSKADSYGAPTLINLFNTKHNRTITWDHLLRQTSDWEGTLWDKPEWADRPAQNPSEWTARERNPAGTVYEYNDVRVNVLALSVLNIWRKPLPQVLKENIMDPIGASASWRWFGYENSWVILDGQLMQAVGGGGHWGGGMFINARDMGRFGYLTLRRGKWKNLQLISDQWISWALTPTPAQPTYGFMNWFLNTDKKFLPSASERAFVHIGNGTNMIYVDPDNDLVVVARWIDNSSMDAFIERVLKSVRK